jgi:beta-N-acetylhexosaminidase
MKDAGRLTLEEKIGQLFFLGFQGYSRDDEACGLHETIRPGGYLLFQRNIESFDQIYELTTNLRETSRIRPLIAVDQEGGRVDRLKHIFMPLPSTAETGLAGTARVRFAARIIASELESTGFNVNFAPVVDVAQPASIFRERMFSSNPAEVGRLALAFVEELSKRNIIACAKHFPGLGGATSDPHFVLPTIGRSRRQLMQEDVIPFGRLIDDVGMIMVSHAHFPGLGDERPVPASLSPRIVNGFLRRKIGFQGLIITDDLTMGAISSTGLTPDLFLRAFEAGNDLMLFSQSTPLVEQAFRTFVREARTSAALRNKVDESVSRMLLLKSRLHDTPVRYRAQIRARLNRQIERLQTSVTTEALRSGTAQLYS